MAITNKIRFGVVGTNFITDWVIAGARQDERFELVAVYSRTQETADAFAARHQIPYTFTSLEEMAQSSLIDAVCFECTGGGGDDRGFPEIQCDADGGDETDADSELPCRT